MRKFSMTLCRTLKCIIDFQGDEGVLGQKPGRRTELYFYREQHSLGPAINEIGDFHLWTLKPPILLINHFFSTVRTNGLFEVYSVALMREECVQHYAIPLYEYGQ